MPGDPSMARPVLPGGVRNAARRLLDARLVFVVAVAVRLGIVLGSKGGPLGNFGYDAGVYYASADALIHGRLPYGDFILLHPPGLMLCLTPFAALGRLTTDHTGFVVAATAFAVLGGVNAVLVVRIARAVQLSRTAALLGGFFYAVWDGSVSSEISARLEPLGSFAFLCGLLFLTRVPDAGSAPSGAVPGRRRNLLLAGAALGFAVSVKIWWIAPALVAAGWQLRSRGRRRDAGPLAAGFGLIVALVDLPFFAAAPSAMWRMVVTDQLSRPERTTSTVARVEKLFSLKAAMPYLHGALGILTLAALAIVVAAVSAAAWRTPRCRLFVVLAATQVIVLLTAPTYFGYYSDYVAASAALVLAAAAQPHPGKAGARWGVAIAGLAAVATAALTSAALFLHSSTAVMPFPGRQLARATAGVRCVMADSPMALIELDALSRGLARGCPNWVDVSGRTYDRDAPAPGRPSARVLNAKWQRDARRYLLSGDAVILIRRGTGLSAATRRFVKRNPVLTSTDGHTVYRTTHADGQLAHGGPH